jgi:hypothetical protein
MSSTTERAGGGWTPEQRKLLEEVRAYTPEQRAAALEKTRAQFTAQDIAEIELRQRKSEKIIARLAATETSEEQERLANELCPAHDNWCRGRNRIQAARRMKTPAPGAGRMRAGRAREHRAAPSRRTSSSSTTSSSDPGSDSDEPAPSRTTARWRSIDEAWALKAHHAIDEQFLDVLALDEGGAL